MSTRGRAIVEPQLPTPRTGRRLTFTETGTSGNVHELGVLREKLVKPDGIAILDLTVIGKFPSLALFMMKGALQIADTTARSSKTIKGLTNGYRRVFGLLLASDLHGIHPIPEPKNLTGEWLSSVEACIRRRWPESTGRSYFRLLRHTLREADASYPKVLPEATSRLLNGNWDAGRSPVIAKHREPYTDGEMARIERASFEAIKRVVRRLKTTGDQLRKEGVDPRLYVDGWKVPANGVWFVENVLHGRVMSMAEISQFIGKWGNANGSWLGSRGFSTNAVYNSIYPDSLDAVPFFLMVAAKTGINVEALQHLQRSDIQPSPHPREIILNIRKARARRHETQTVAVAASGWRSAGGLLKIYMALTEKLAKVLGRSDVWLTVEPGQYSGRIRSQSWIRNTYKFRDHHALRNDSGAKLHLLGSRLRSTQKTLTYRRFGNLALAGQDHRNDDTTVDYVTNRLTKDIHEQTVTEALSDFDSFFRGHIISGNEGLKRASSIIGADQATTSRVLSGEQDMFVAACRDFYNAPGAPSGEPCGRPWQCFVCANAIWTRNILPRLLNFVDFIEDQRSLLDTEDWTNKFGIQYEIIQRKILPAFSKEVLEAAKHQKSIDTLYVPVSMKVR